jgi:twitching motility protein PilT
MLSLDEMLTYVRDYSGSDLHLAAGRVPRIRRHGALEEVSGTPAPSHAELSAMLQKICTPRIWEHFQSHRDMDLAYALRGVGRFRVNLFNQEHGVGAVFRLIPEQIVTLEELRLPPAVEKFAHLDDGFVLVTGPTGSGKSTTLAAIVDRINSTYAKHIVTIEDPVEFVHQNKKSVISHREIGTDSKGFAQAVRMGTREDTDVLLLGELRDYETIARALDAAEMGILVLATLHTNSAASTIARIVDVFPGEQQAMVRTILAGALSGVLSQTLLPRADGRGRVAALEILFRTPAMAAVIRDGNTSMIDSIIQSGRGEGMQLLDDALFDAVRRGDVAPRVAHVAARDKARFERLAPVAPGTQTAKIR